MGGPFIRGGTEAPRGQEISLRWQGKLQQSQGPRWGGGMPCPLVSSGLSPSEECSQNTLPGSRHLGGQDWLLT